MEGRHGPPTEGTVQDFSHLESQQRPSNDMKGITMMLHEHGIEKDMKHRSVYRTADCSRRALPPRKGHDDLMACYQTVVLRKIL